LQLIKYLSSTTTYKNGEKMNKHYDTDDSYNEEIINYNEEEVFNSTEKNDVSQLVVYSRDWTVQTIVQQIEEGNVDLNPDFQRRNVWNNEKRSRLIESLMIGYPVPEIVLAEVIGEKKKYIVIDGKQRLLAIYGFMEPNAGIWDGIPKLNKQTILSNNNGLTYAELNTEQKRRFLNSDVRCTLLSGYKNYSTLYDIFYRLNTGSSPLTMQELRNSIYKGDFSKLVTKHTDKDIPLRRILNIRGADKRFKDAELLLKFLFIEYSDKKYSGSLRKELDRFTSEMNASWYQHANELISLCDKFNDACQLLLDIFDLADNNGLVAKKWLSNKNTWESRFNRSLFEVQVHYAIRMLADNITIDRTLAFEIIESIQDAFNNELFVSSVESTTAGSAQHHDRFSIFFQSLNMRLGKKYCIPTSVDF
jgi:hypothetical protein